MLKSKNHNVSNDQYHRENISLKEASTICKLKMIDNCEITDIDNFLTNFTDEELISAIRTDENKYILDFLIKKYINFVRFKTRSYFLIGAEREDIIQEGLIGLYKAVRDFQDNKFSSFRSFAELCITRQIITAVKTSTRQKHIPLNSYTSLNKQIYDDSDRTLLDILSEIYVSDPEELIMKNEEFSIIESKLKSILTKLEWQVFISYLSGNSYKEIAIELNRQIKSIDNALQRIKQKLGQFVTESHNKEALSNLIYGTSLKESYQYQIS